MGGGKRLSHEEEVRLGIAKNEDEQIVSSGPIIEILDIPKVVVKVYKHKPEIVKKKAGRPKKRSK